MKIITEMIRMNVQKGKRLKQQEFAGACLHTESLKWPDKSEIWSHQFLNSLEDQKSFATHFYITAENVSHLWVSAGV